MEADYLRSQEILGKMLIVYERAEEMSRGHTPKIAARVAVAFFSEGAGEH
jgi:hypothetical protein